MKGIFIDTQLWSYSKKKPIQKQFTDEKKFKEVHETHIEAKTFFSEIKKTGKQIFFSTHQIAEIYHVLSFRGHRIPVNQSIQFLRSLKTHKQMKIIEVTWTHITDALIKSRHSSIHIWDYLCILPIIDYIEEAYTSDRHFQHQSFKKKGLNLRNPLSKWETI